MTDLIEIETLKASYRGARAASDALAALRARIEGLDSHGDIDPAMLEEIARVAHAHAVAAQALRGFIGTMQARRGAGAA